MKIYNTADPQNKPSLVMLVYGEGGVGKTTFASTAPNPILADCEGGAKYFGLRGITMDVAPIETWSDIGEFVKMIRTSPYNTIVIDPIGELMEKQKRFIIARKEPKNVQRDGSLTMGGWGTLKDNMRAIIKELRDCGKHILIIAHVDEKTDEQRMVKRPLILTKLSEEIINMVDVVGYMTQIRNEDGNVKRVIIVDPESDKYTAKDRTGQLGRIIEPDFQKIINACQGTETYSWSKPKVEVEVKQEEPVVVPINEFDDSQLVISPEEAEKAKADVDQIIRDIEKSENPYLQAESLLKSGLFPLTPKQKLQLQAICAKYHSQSLPVSKKG